MRAWILLFTLAVLLVVVAEGYSRKRWDDKGIHKRHLHHLRSSRHHQWRQIEPRSEDAEVDGYHRKGLLGRGKNKKGHHNGILKSGHKKNKHHLSLKQKVQLKIAKTMAKQMLKKN